MALASTPQSSASWQSWPQAAKQRYLATLKNRNFGQRYYNDPAGFLRDCVLWPDGQSWAPYQLEIVAALVEHERVAVRSSRGAGKTAILGGLVHWFALTREAMRVNWKVLAAASIWRQLTLFAFPEVSKMAHMLDWSAISRPDGPYRMGDELQGMAIKLKYGRVDAVSSQEGATIEGGHADELLLLFDEAKIIPASIWDSARGMMTSGRCYWLAQSTPGPQAGRFYELFARQRGWDDWWLRHVTIDEARAAGRVSQEWAEKMGGAYDADSPFYRQQVMGEFASDDGGGLVPLTWVEYAQRRWEVLAANGWRDNRGRELPVSCLSFDVGGGAVGGDASTIAIIRGGVIVERVIKIAVAPDPSVATMHLAGEVKTLIDQYKPRWVFGDDVGIGLGVVHRLREMGYNVWGFTAGAATSMTDLAGMHGYDSWRSAAWHGLRDLLSPLQAEGLKVALPPDAELTGDLTSVGEGGMNSRGQLRTESKDSIRKRIGRSTDQGDSVAAGLLGPVLAELWLMDHTDRRQVVFDPLVVGRE